MSDVILYAENLNFYCCRKSMQAFEPLGKVALFFM
jgi:hypothetical protein